MQGKQAKIVSPTQERAILGYLATTRYPARDHIPPNLVVTTRASHNTLALSICYPHDVSSA